MPIASKHPDLHLPPPDTTLASLLLSTKDHGRRTAEPLFYPPPAGSVFSSNRPQAKPMSLDDVRDRAYAVAKGLIDGRLSPEKPFKKGDVVAFFSLNQHDYTANVLGIQLAGGVAALCNPSYKAKELAHQLRMTSARCVLASNAAPFSAATGQIDTKAETAFDVAKEGARLAQEEDDDDVKKFPKIEGPLRVMVFEEGAGDDSWETIYRGYKVDEALIKQVDERASELKGSDTAIYCFSSGTSGLPKAVNLTHRNLVSNVIQSTFLLHDRVNEPLEQGHEYAPDRKTGWYDTAEPKGAGRDVLPDGYEEFVKKKKKRESHSSGQGTGPIKESINKLVDGIKKLNPASKDEDQTDNLYKRSAEDEFHIDVLPQFHCYGLVVNLVALHTCTPRIILPRFHLETYLRSISKHGVTFSFVVPPIILALAKHPSIDNYDLSSLWRVASGAASLPTEIAFGVAKRLGIRCTDGYGMTEMSPIISIQTVSNLKERIDSVGRLAPSTEAMILDPDGKELEVGQPGELLLRGPQMMAGYLHNEEANAQTFAQVGGSTWLRTGDVAFIDEKGFIKITDRLKDVIKSKGFQVSPAELEGLFYKDEWIQDVAVTGVRDAGSEEEKVWAFAVAHPRAVEEEGDAEKRASTVLKKVNAQVANYKKVQGLTWIDALPKSDAGKVLKKNLAAMR